MEFNTNQKEAIHTIDGNMVVIAAAGSGKTSVLTYRILNMVKNYGVDPTTILAVTFSKKAKESIEQRLGNLGVDNICLLYTTPSQRDLNVCRMPSDAWSS